MQDKHLQYLPTEEDLPDTDNIPVDNELQVFIPSLLRAILSLLWADRFDWFFGVNMGVYYELEKPAIGPDGFLSLGVQRHKGERGRLSYVLWQENVIPQLVMEFVSKSPGDEYNDKMTRYAAMGALYYVIYNPNHWQQDRHDKFEVYRLVNGAYVQQLGNPVWLPEINLGIGYEQGTFEGWTREWLYWYDSQSHRLLAPENIIEQERQRTQQERLRAEEQQRTNRAAQELADLITKLQERGINLNDL